jgi:hypothetical protein
VLLKLTPWKVTVCPLTDSVAFQNPVTAWPAGNVTVTVQPVIVLEPVLVTRDGWITYPVAHWVWATKVMEQPPGPGGAVVGGVVVGGAVVGGAEVGGRVVGGLLVGGGWVLPALSAVRTEV